MPVMIDLDTCLKESGIIKKDIYIKTFEETDQIAKNVSMGEMYNITFEKSSLKSRFFMILKERREDLYIINCDANESRLKEDIDNSYGLIIYDNVIKSPIKNLYILNKTSIC